jgi:hypothetical protein
VEGREKGMRKGSCSIFSLSTRCSAGGKVEGFGVVPSFTALFVLIRADYSDRTHLLFLYFAHSHSILIFTLLSILFFISSFFILHSPFYSLTLNDHMCIEPVPLTIYKYNPTLNR